MITEIDGFKCYDSELAIENDDFESLCYPAYQNYIPNNFWYEARNQIISQTIKKYTAYTPNSNFFEIGCGNGFVIKHIKTSFPKFTFYASDIYIEALKYAKQNNPNGIDFFQYNIFKNNLQKQFDLIGCFDVLEHIDDDLSAMLNINNLLSENGNAIITVPSNMKIWSNNDVINKHKRRYSKSELKEKLNKNGFEILHINHFVFFLYPLLYIKAKLQKKEIQPNNNSTDIASLLNLKINPVLNSIFKVIMKFELVLINLGVKFPFGSSLICVVKKKGIHPKT